MPRPRRWPRTCGRFLADEPIRARQVSTSERYWRWARRNPVIAVLGGVLTAVLVATTVGSLVAASHFQTIARSESFANQRSQLDRKDAIEARREAIAERDHSRQLSAGLALEKAITLGEEGRADHGLLWMLEALKTAPEDSEGFRKAVRWNLGAWLGQVHKPLRISKSIGLCTHLGFSPDGKTFATGFFARDRELATPVVLWDTASGAKLKTLAGAFAPFVFQPDGKVLFATAQPRGVLAIELATERVLWTTPALPGEYASAIDLSSDGSTVLAHRHDRTGWNALVVTAGRGHRASRVESLWNCRVSVPCPRAERPRRPFATRMARCGSTFTRFPRAVGSYPGAPADQRRMINSFVVSLQPGWKVALRYRSQRGNPLSGRQSILSNLGHSNMGCQSVRSWQARPIPFTLPPPIGS